MPRIPSLCFALQSFLAVVALIFALPASAGSVYFSLDRTGNNLVVTNMGNSSAFYPRVLRLNSNGQWETLPPKPGKGFPAELAATAKFEVLWTEPSGPASAASGTPLEATQPMMIRFFDQAGSGFGQISFFNQPASSATAIPSAYVDGKLKFSPDGAIRNSWLLWAQEEGISPLTKPVHFEHAQPPAKQIDWQVQKDQPLDLGAGQPSAMLLHAMQAGWQLQIVGSGGLQGHEQKSAWLSASDSFYLFAKSVGAATLIAFITLLIGLWRNRTINQAKA